ncbi:hypothetical protein GGI15_000907 [Coemansia interrupta]|uniref:Survival Motor Neuron Gemin2-binding domain-containing protein n=1 Tax=Coemansia interrupta TaxID=1126814 RepID=A0A9W8HR72_9FUNG|nr:hypothetical protein GGI15_000907 [Coemansia interrupta]
MSAQRAIVSYDDLYDEFDVAPVSAPATLTRRKRMRSTITISGTPGQDPDSCTSASDTETDQVSAMQRDWDDSDLIRMWDSTVAEYRRQHALLMEDEAYRAQQHRSESWIGQWTSVDGRPVDAKKKRRVGKAVETQQPVAIEAAETSAEMSAQTVDPAGFTDAGFGVPTSEDDALNKLNMAWYYTGYYAGYYQVEYGIVLAYRSGIAGSTSTTSTTTTTTSAPAEAPAAAAAAPPPPLTTNDAVGGSTDCVVHPRARQQGPRDAGSPEHIVIDDE